MYSANSLRLRLQSIQFAVSTVEYQTCRTRENIHLSNTITFRFARHNTDSSFQVILYILPILCGEISSSLDSIIRSQNFFQTMIEFEYHFGAFGLTATEHRRDRMAYDIKSRTAIFDDSLQENGLSLGMWILHVRLGTR